MEPCMSILGPWIITSHKPHDQVTFIRLKQTISDKFRQFREFVASPNPLLPLYKNKIQEQNEKTFINEAQCSSGQCGSLCLINRIPSTAGKI